jgi:hypothetical protein
VRLSCREAIAVPQGINIYFMNITGILELDLIRTILMKKAMGRFDPIAGGKFR